MEPLRIVIWDDEPERLRAAEAELKHALRELCLEGEIASQCEPPLLARMGLTGRTPVLEIDGQYWHLGPGRTPDRRSCCNLLRQLRKCQEPTKV